MEKSPQNEILFNEIHIYGADLSSNNSQIKSHNSFVRYEPNFTYT